jgi:hypothetical protein
MKYFCLGYFNKEKMDALPTEEVEGIMLECQPHIKNLYSSSNVLMDVGISQEMKRLKRLNGEIQTESGMPNQLEKVIGSAFILEAENMDKAIQIASLHPTVQVKRGEQLGWEIEIFAIDSFDLKE